MVKSTNISGSNVDPKSNSKDGLIASSMLSNISSTPILHPKAELMRKVNKDIPLNKDYNLPEYIYRADLIPNDLNEMSLEDHDNHLNNAIVELDYSEGFPTMPNGEPLWAKLQCESAEAYKAFSAYLDMPRPEHGTAQPVRQIHMLRALTAQSIENLLSMSHMFYWQPRAMAYDAFTIASHSKMKEHRLLAAEGEHYDMTVKFLSSAQQMLLDRMADSDNEMSAKEILDIIKFMTQLQRLSLGAQPFSVGVPEGSRTPMNQSLEVIMRTLTGGGQQTRVVSAQDSTKKLFENEADLMNAQELIIKLQGQNDPRKAKQLTFEDGDNGL